LSGYAGCGNRHPLLRRASFCEGKVMEAVQDEAVAAFMRHYYDNKIFSTTNALAQRLRSIARSLRSLLSG